MKKYIAIILTLIALIGFAGCNSDSNSTDTNNPNAEPELTFDEKCDLAFKTILWELYEYDVDNPEEGSSANLVFSHITSLPNLQIEKEFILNEYSFYPPQEKVDSKEQDILTLSFCEFQSDDDLDVAMTLFNDVALTGDYEERHTCINLYPYLISVSSLYPETINQIISICDNLDVFS